MENSSNKSLKGHLTHHSVRFFGGEQTQESNEELTVSLLTLTLEKSISSFLCYIIPAHVPDSCGG